MEASADATWAPALNDAQRAAATHGHRDPTGSFSAEPLLVIAGAGTGKTNTLAHRVAFLRLNGVPADRLLLLTFTRRAAETMTRRAERILQQAASRQPGLQAKLSWAGTFHSIANRLLRSRAHQVGLDPAFSVMDRGDAADLLDVVRQDLGLAKKDKRFPRKDTCLAIYSHKINTQRPLRETLEDQFPWCVDWHSELSQLFGRYVAVKQDQQVLDYDDLLLYWHVAMQDAGFAAEVGSLFDHVLVDEYQDTNTLQADILLALKPSGQGLCVVGDDAQSIYSFRAATVDNILGFPARFTPAARVVTLEQNYRSVQPILDAANAVIGEGTRQYRKALHSTLRSPQRPFLVAVQDDQAQADYIVEQVLARRETGVDLKQQAVLMRSSHHSDVLELELVRRNIPYVKHGGLRFLDAAHVKDVLALLKWADNPRNYIAGFRVLQLLPGVGPGHANRCLKVLEASGHSWDMLVHYQMPVAAREDWAATTQLLQQLAAAPQWAGQVTAVRQWYEPHLHRIYDSSAVRLGDIEQLEQLSGQFTSRERFLTELTLDPPQASGDRAGTPLLDEDYLILSTIHSAKGQEWDTVFVLNVADGNFPNEYQTGKPDTIEEERRLLHVAMTRAKHALHLVAPLKYHVTHQGRTGDRHVYGARSRFLTDRVMQTLDATAWPPATATSAPAPSAVPRIDVGARMRAMWD